MSITTNTEAGAVVPEQWELNVLKYRYSNEVIGSRCLNASDTLLKYGDIYHFPTENQLSVETISSSTLAFTPQTLTPGDNTVTVNTPLAASFEVSVFTKRQANVSLMEQYSPAMGKAIAQKQENLLAASAASIPASQTVNSVDAPRQFDEDLAFAALLKMADNELLEEKSNLSFFVKPIALLEGLYKKDRWTAANMTGMPKSVLTAGYEFPVLGVPIYTTNQIGVSGGSAQCFLAHKEWLGFVRQIKQQVREAEGTAAGKLTDIKVAFSFFGYGILRQTYAALFHVQNQSRVA